MTVIPILARGAIAAERVLIEGIERVVRRDDDLARPIRVVVPSRSLRDHLAATVVRRTGRAILGLEITTHLALARQIVARHLPPSTEPALPLPIVARRAASDPSALRRLRAESPKDVAGAIESAAVRSAEDLLDAGLEPVHADAIEDLLADAAEHTLDRDAVARARAVVTVARSAAHALEAESVTHHPLAILRRATALLTGGDQAVVSEHGVVSEHSVFNQHSVYYQHSAVDGRGLFVYGYADTTAVVGDFLEAVLVATGGTLIVDLPSAVDGSDGPSEIDVPARWLLRFGFRLTPDIVDAGPARPAIRVEAADTTRAEIERVGWSIRDRIDSGVRPESIGLVARDLAPFRRPVESVFEELGIPYSAPYAAGAIDPAGRSIAALVAFLDPDTGGPELGVDRFLDLLPVKHQHVEHQHVDHQGVDHERVDHPRALTLAARRGIARIEDLVRGTRGDDDRALARVADIAIRAYLAWRRLVAESRDPIASHRSRIDHLLDNVLGWPAEGTARERLDSAFASAWGALDPRSPLRFDEALWLAGSALEAAQRGPFGGRGGGIQVLDVAAARGRTFDHLFVVGLVRDGFPKPSPTDPLLPDWLRRAMRPVLPELAIKSWGRELERYHFASLLGASPDITLSHARHDARGRKRAPSVWLRTLMARRDPLAEGGSTEDGSIQEHRSSFDQALRKVATSGNTDVLEPWLRAAFGRVDDRLADLGRPVSGRAIRARARLATTAAFEPGPDRRSVLEPFLGLVGPPTDDTDPRRHAFAITNLEAMAACPWQAFLERLLRLRPADDPLMSLPGLDPDRIGTLVHRVLERIAGPWPSEKQVLELIDRETERLLTARGIHFRALRQAASARVRPMVESARSDARDGFQAVATERRFESSVDDADGNARRIAMRVDRIDRDPRWPQRRPQSPRLTDYKTGRPLVRSADPAVRRRALTAAAASGRWLQAAAGLALTFDDQPIVASRYLFLAPDLDPDEREVLAARHDRGLARAFTRSLAVLGRALDTGAFPPRLTHAEVDAEPRRCRHCEVRDACLRGDSAARARQRDWADSATREHDSASSAARALWRLDATGSSDAS